MINTDDEAERLYQKYKHDPNAALNMRLEIRQKIRAQQARFFLLIGLPLGVLTVIIVLLIHYWS